MRAVTISAAILMLTTGAAARDRDERSAQDKLDRMVECAKVSDLAARVACYDDAARQALATATPAAKPIQPDKAFGLETAERRPPKPARAREARLDQISAALIAASDPGDRGLWLFALDNGTRWRMTETTELELPQHGQRVTIHRTLLGGYLLDLNRSAAVRVVRVD